MLLLLLLLLFYCYYMPQRAYMEPGQNEGVFALVLNSVRLDEMRTSDELLEQVTPPGDPMGILSNDLLLQPVTTDQVQYIQVVDEHNQVQYIQLTCDGSDAGSLVHLIDANLVDPVVSSKGHKDTSYPLDQNEAGILLPDNADHVTSDAKHQRASKKALDDQESVAVGLDLNRPITLTEDTVVIIDDEKCVLRLEPGTKSLVAYPIKDESDETKNDLTTKRKRGRPPKSAKNSSSDNSIIDCSKNLPDVKLENSDEDEKSGILSEQENSAAECLLGLADGRRKSSRVKKKPSQLTDYEIERQKEDSSRTMSLSNGVMVSISGVLNAGVEKSADDVMVPQLTTPNQMQNFLANLGLPVKRGRGRPRRRPLPVNPVIYSQNLLPALMPKSNLVTTPPDSMPVLKETAIIIQQEDGTEKHILVSSAAEPSLDFASLVPETKLDLNATSFPQTSQQPIDGVMTSQPLEGIMTSQPLEGVATLEGEMHGTPTVYQMTNLLPLKSEPVRIGPKMKEEELANLRCSKCNFQALYSHQFQQHIAEQHSDENSELFRCKCCNFLSFSKDVLQSHFRDCHPKCICYVCGFTAEHSYIVKRHMQRHDTSGCECSVCGKKYKDQYILKMHFKMVHMPAEVLFQCTICSKEFTRKAHLKRHLRIHNPDKPFKCPHCEYRGCERSDINKHLLIHNEPKYTCEICLKTFRHVKNKELHVRRHQGQRDYTCGVCGFLGYTFTDIRKHIERKHMEARHVCKQCGVVFKSEALLREHRCELILLEEALGASGGEETEEAYTNDMIQLVSEENQFLLTDPQQIIVSSSPANLALETLTLPDESLPLMETPVDQDQVIVEV